MTIDELVFEFKLDHKQWGQGAKETLDEFKKIDDEMDKRQKNLEARNKNVGYSFNNVTYAAEGLFTALAGAGMASFARDTMNSVAATGRMAVNIGETTGALSTFGRMVERNGGDANTAAGSMKGLVDQMTRLNTFGEGSQELFKFLGIIGGAQGDSPIETFMKFAAWAEKNKDNPQLVNIIGQSGGLDQGTINEAMKGRTQVMKDFAAASQGAVNPEQVAAMIKMQDAWTTLDQRIADVGRRIVTDFSPAVVSTMSTTTDWINHNEQLATTLGKVLTAIVGLSALKPALWVLRLLGLTNPTTLAVGVAASAGYAASSALPDGVVKSMDEKFPLLGKLDALFGLGPQTAASNDTGPTAGGAFKSQAEKEAFIRKSAMTAGIDPNIAMAVARSEGFNKFSGDNNTSFGAFQLHVTPGGRGHAVGDQFKEDTGLDPADPKNEHESIMYAMEYVKRHGWRDFHGAANSGIGNQQGIGTVNIGDINVVTTSANPKEHGRAVAAEIKSQLADKMVAQANTGLH